MVEVMMEVEVEVMVVVAAGTITSNIYLLAHTY
jgi:hypothetical protein